MKKAHNLKTIMYTLVCASCTATQCAIAEISQEKLEQFMKVISIRVYPHELRQALKNRLESFEGDIEPYIRETIKSDIPYYRERAMSVISATEATSLLPLIIDRFLNDGDSNVRQSALSDINWFLENSDHEELLDRETVETLGSRVVGILADETLEISDAGRSDVHVRNELRLIRNLKYLKAREVLVDIWNEDREGFRQYSVLEALYAIDHEKADDLLHRPDAREKFGDDRPWFRALARSAKHNEKSLAIVKDIIDSVAEQRSEYRMDRMAAINVALVLGADEHRQWVLDIIRDGAEVQKLHVLYQLMRHPKSILRDEEDQNIVINAIKENQKIHDRIAQSYHNYAEEGTIGEWLMSPGSPLRDKNENGLDK